MSITTNVERIGNFTSSQISRLLGSPAVKDTYIEERNIERMLLRSLDKEENARTLTWGKLCEQHLNNTVELLGLNYQAMGDITKVHPDYDYWSGSSDGVFEDEDIERGISEIKCPFTMKSFVAFALAIETGKIEEVRKVKVGSKKVGEDYYWQMVSNACIEGVDWAELIVYCPFKMEIPFIQETASGMEDLNAYAWVNFAKEESLPYLNEGGRFKNINKIRFKVPESDKKKLEEAVVIAGTKLIRHYED